MPSYEERMRAAGYSPGYDIESDIFTVRGILHWWRGQTGPEANAKVKELEARLAYLLGIVTGSTVQGGSGTAPTIPGTPTASLATNTVTLTWTGSTATTPATVASYNVYRSLGGAYALLKSVSSLNTTDALPPSTSATYKVSAVDTFGLESTLSAASNTVTTSGGLTPDVTAPNAPGIPVLDSAAGISPYTVHVAAVTDIVVGGAVTSGMVGGGYPVYVSGALAETRPTPALGASFQSLNILFSGNSAPSGPGTDDGTTISDPNNGEHYGAGDSFFMRAKAATGDVLIDYTVTTLTPNAGSQYCKGGIEFRQSSDPSSPYINLFIAGATYQGTLQLYCEQRLLAGAQATQTILGGGSPTSVTLPFRVRITRAHNNYLMQYATNPASPSWQTLTTKTVSMGDTIFAGRFANKCAWVYTENSFVSASTVSYIAVGSPGTSFPVGFGSYDAATPPNVRAVANTLTVSISGAAPPPSGSGDLCAYVIGCEPRYTVSGVDNATVTRMSKNMCDVINCYTFWDQSHGGLGTLRSIFAAVKARNANWKGGNFSDTTNCDTNFETNMRANFWGALFNGGFQTFNGDGVNGGFVGNWTAPSGLTFTNPPGTASLDSHGRTMPQACADYLVDAYRDGGSNGDSNQGMGANNLLDFIGSDDMYLNLWITGDWTPNNVNANTLLRQGQAALFPRIQTPTRAGTPSTLGVAANVSQINANSPCPAEYMGILNYAIGEAIGSLVDGDVTYLINTLAEQKKTLVNGGKHLFIDYDADIAGDAHRLAAYCSSRILGSEYYSAQASSGDTPRGISYVASLPWDDWYDIDTTTAVCKTYAASGVGGAWRGDWVDSAATTAWQNGVYMRRSANGIFLFRPSGVGPVTVILPGTYRVPLSATYGPMNGSGSVSNWNFTGSNAQGMILVL